MKRTEQELDEMLGRLGESSPPPAPANVEQNVLRRIRLAAPDHSGWRPAFWPRWLTNPTFGLGLALVSGAIGILFTSMAGAGGKTGLETEASADPLAIFSIHGPGMLSRGEK